MRDYQRYRGLHPIHIKDVVDVVAVVEDAVAVVVVDAAADVVVDGCFKMCFKSF